MAAAPQQDHYSVLGVQRFAPEGDVRRAFRTAALQSHPDKNPEGEAHFKELAAAYEVLTDEQKRRSYDIDLRYQESKKPGFRPPPPPDRPADAAGGGSHASGSTSRGTPTATPRGGCGGAGGAAAPGASPQRGAPFAEAAGLGASSIYAFLFRARAECFGKKGDPFAERAQRRERESEARRERERLRTELEQTLFGTKPAASSAAPAPGAESSAAAEMSDFLQREREQHERAAERQRCEREEAEARERRRARDREREREQWEERRRRDKEEAERRRERDRERELSRFQRQMDELAEARDAENRRAQEAKERRESMERGGAGASALPAGVPCGGSYAGERGPLLIPSDSHILGSLGRCDLLQLIDSLQHKLDVARKACLAGP
eukprot:TRINITY_DN56265_c0_g1_i1.p1 TRINITY_DN56265_c0_g1~~TRINITY_DN56265_c0_g1_i1.p1  ORF type:complete len:406 (+),score=113.43 TRINITY_DN56265_c0_g1_i1:77-1219(+)